MDVGAWVSVIGLASGLLGTLIGLVWRASTDRQRLLTVEHRMRGMRKWRHWKNGEDTKVHMAIERLEERLQIPQSDRISVHMRPYEGDGGDGES